MGIAHPDERNGFMLRRGRQRGWRADTGASEPVIEFDRRPFEHPVLSPGRPPFSFGLRAFPRTLDRLQSARASRRPRLKEGRE
jgi:hypothetical protein